MKKNASTKTHVLITKYDFDLPTIKIITFFFFVNKMNFVRNV